MALVFLDVACLFKKVDYYKTDYEFGLGLLMVVTNQLLQLGVLEVRFVMFFYPLCHHYTDCLNLHIVIVGISFCEFCES